MNDFPEFDANTNKPAQQIDLASESVAGEEDPGASMDMAGSSPGAHSAGGGGVQPFEPAGELHPGDEAPPGTPGSGENICRECGGSGQLAAEPCPACGGTGKVIVGMGGG
jgi:hypothetical protein